MTVGGWIDSLAEFKKVTRLGADKVAVNTEAFRRPELIAECAAHFGTQCFVLSIDAKLDNEGEYKVYIDRGQERTEASPFAWAAEAKKLGVGEILVNSVDNDGFRKGYDMKLLKGIRASVTIPVIAMGGVFTWDDLVDGLVEGCADAVAAANIFHYTEHSTKKAKDHMRAKGVDVR